jgi:hypothetical protein
MSGVALASILYTAWFVLACFTFIPVLVRHVSHGVGVIWFALASLYEGVSTTHIFLIIGVGQSICERPTT